MQKVAVGSGPSWLSTHPSSVERAQLLKANLNVVVPLYEKALARKGEASPRPN
jgi:hypothetical protein